MTCFVLRLLYCRERIQKLPCLQLTGRDQGTPTKNHTQSRKAGQCKLTEDAAHRDTFASSPLLEAPHPDLQGSSSLSSGSLDRNLLLSWMSVLKPMLNTNTTGTQTTEDDVLVPPPFTCQILSKSFNCEVTKQRPVCYANCLAQYSHEHPKSHIIF